MALIDYPSIDFIRQALRYEDGKLFWLNRPRDHFPSTRGWNIYNARFADKEAGTIREDKTDKRHLIQFGARKKIRIYRYTIVWALHKNEWCLELDHENHNSLDDRIENLRPATRSNNLGNAKIRRDNISGIKGVCWDSSRQKWMAQIRVRNRHKCLGRFESILDAKAAYMTAAREHFGEFATDGT